MAEIVSELVQSQKVLFCNWLTFPFIITWTGIRTNEMAWYIFNLYSKSCFLCPLIVLRWWKRETFSYGSHTGQTCTFLGVPACLSFSIFARWHEWAEKNKGNFRLDAKLIYLLNLFRLISCSSGSYLVSRSWLKYNLNYWRTGAGEGGLGAQEKRTKKNICEMACTEVGITLQAVSGFKQNGGIRRYFGLETNLLLGLKESCKMRNTPYITRMLDIK